MKYVICCVLDQTFGFITEDGGSTTVHKEAKFFDTEEEVKKKVDEMNAHFVPDSVEFKRHSVWFEKVVDLEEFCAREDTW